MIPTRGERSELAQRTNARGTAGRAALPFAPQETELGESTIMRWFPARRE